MGLTHNFYRYPACMSPDLAHALIRQFTEPGDYVLDPFMGGGTSIVEALASGRLAVGVDINALAAFVTSVKTTPLSASDQTAIRRWAEGVSLTAKTDRSGYDNDPRTRNLPIPVLNNFATAIETVNTLPFPRQQRLARCALLRLGQWAIDCRSTLATEFAQKERLRIFVEDMLTGLNQFAAAVQDSGEPKNRITGRRMLLLRSAVDVEVDPKLARILGKPKLVLTSPPYPGVHVLYNRWQVAGRRETPAPYWIIDAKDGQGPSYYTLGSRCPFGLKNYFRTLAAAYRSIHKIVHPDATVAQLVAFSDTESQLPMFLETMRQAGFEEYTPVGQDQTAFWRRVPHRKWYNCLDPSRGPARELLLFHRPRAL